MFLTPKVFNFNVYQSLDWPGKLSEKQSQFTYSFIHRLNFIESKKIDMDGIFEIFHETIVCYIDCQGNR